MDQWFDISQRRFQLFLEFKLEIFAAVSEPIAESILLFTAARGSSNATATGGCGDAKPPVELDGQLRCLPSSSTFLDDVHSLMAHTYIRLDDGFSGGDDSAQHREEMEKENDKDEDGEDEEGEDNNPFLYGELLPAGVRSLLFDTPAVAKALTPTEDDSEAARAAAALSFVDFGSGVGKLVFESTLLLNPHFYREMSNSKAAAGAQQPQEEPQTSSSRSSSSKKKNTVTIRCIGIELCPRRHAVAEQAMRVLPPSLLEHHAATCLHGSFFDAFEGEDSAAVVFACALGFNDAMTSQLCDRLMALHAKYHRLKVAVLLLRTIPMKHPLFSSVGGAHVKISMTSLATTWMDEASAIVVEWL